MIVITLLLPESYKDDHITNDDVMLAGCAAKTREMRNLQLLCLTPEGKKPRRKPESR